MLFYDLTLSFINETYLLLAMCAAINCYYFMWDSWGKTVNCLSTLATIILVVSFPIIIKVFYTRKANFDKVKSNDK